MSRIRYQTREVFVFNLVVRGGLEERILALLEEKISMFELVVGEVGDILGGVDEEREFSDLVLGAWLEQSEAASARAFETLGEKLEASRRRLEDAKALDDKLFGEDFETALEIGGKQMSALREFVADLLTAEGAVVETTEPDGLEVLAPEPLRAALGLEEFSRLGFGASAPAGAAPVTLEGEWLDRFGALLGERGRFAERELEGADSPAPNDPERLLDRALDLQNAVWRLRSVSRI